MSGAAVLAGVVAATAAGVVSWAGADAAPVEHAAAGDMVHATQSFVSGKGFALPAVKRDRFTSALGSLSSSGIDVGGAMPAGAAQQYAAKLIDAKGWKDSEFGCLVQLWSHESGWNVHAASGSGAYGIPQAYPGSKMGAAGGDWQNDAKVQIRWGLGYIEGRYGTPCGAWTHFQSAWSY